MALRKLLTNRNAILGLALLLGFASPSWAQMARPLLLPAVVVVMTVSFMRIPTRVFVSLKGTVRPMILGASLNLILMAAVILGLSWAMTADDELRAGFVILAVAPPGIGILPFAHVLRGDIARASLGLVGAYLATLVVAPLLILLLPGVGTASPVRLLVLMGEFIVGPILLSRGLVLTRLAGPINRHTGQIVNWGFFVVLLIVVGLNRSVFIGDPRTLLVCGAVAMAGTFVLGGVIRRASRRMTNDPRVIVNAELLGTVKNSAWATATALILVGDRAASPAAVMSVTTVTYLLWLSWRDQRTVRQGGET